MTELLSVLCKCNKLKILDISDNNISIDQGEKLANLIKSLPSIKILKLDDCNI